MDYFKKLYKNFDFWLLVPIVLIVGFSLIILLNATASPFDGDEQSMADYMEKMNFNTIEMQALWFGIRLLAFFAITIVDYDVITEYSKYAWWALVAFLVALSVFGHTINGTTAWFKMFDRSVQPSEFCKVVLILVLARMIAKKMEDHGGLVRFRDLWGLFFFFGIPFVLVILQPDLGTALVFFVILLAMMFIGKISWKNIGILLTAIIAFLPVAWLLMADYQKDRLLNFNVTPTGGEWTQVGQSIDIISSGGSTGKGLFAPGAFAQLDYLPEKTNDFIFAVTAETVGFWGGLILILLYLALLARIMYIAIKSPHVEGQLIAVGVFAMFLFHIVENIGMTMGIMPVTGIPLPLFSAGGSNMLVCMIALGLVENVAMRRQRNLIKES